MNKDISVKSQTQQQEADARGLMCNLEALENQARQLFCNYVDDLSRLGALLEGLDETFKQLRAPYSVNEWAATHFGEVGLRRARRARQVFRKELTDTRQIWLLPLSVTEDAAKPHDGEKRPKEPPWMVAQRGIAKLQDNVTPEKIASFPPRQVDLIRATLLPINRLLYPGLFGAAMPNATAEDSDNTKNV